MNGYPIRNDIGEFGFRSMQQAMIAAERFALGMARAIARTMDYEVLKLKWETPEIHTAWEEMHRNPQWELEAPAPEDRMPDLHTTAAMEISGLPKASITPTMRRMGKLLNFGMYAYGPPIPESQAADECEAAKDFLKSAGKTQLPDIDLSNLEHKWEQCAKPLPVHGADIYTHKNRDIPHQFPATKVCDMHPNTLKNLHRRLRELVGLTIKPEDGRLVSLSLSILDMWSTWRWGKKPEDI
jgi:hypothetical protein